MYADTCVRSLSTREEKVGMEYVRTCRQAWPYARSSGKNLPSKQSSVIAAIYICILTCWGILS